MSIPSATCCLRIPALTSGLELVVDVLAAGLVLDEGERVRELADVVVVRRDAGHERIGADRLGGPFREIADHERVVVGPRRLDEKPAQQRLGRIRELEQLEDRQDPEDRAEHRVTADRGDARPRRRRRADANHSSRTPWMSRVTGTSLAPSNEKTETTSAQTANTAIEAWRNTCRRSPRRTAMIPAIPPRKM